MAKYSDEIKEAARTLFIKSWTPKDIAQELNIPVRTIYHWSDIGQWAALLPVESFEAAITRRHDQLSRRENKTALELEEIRDLVAHHIKLMAQSNKHAEKMAEIKTRMAMQSGGEDETGFGSERKRSYRKNDISSITKEMLDSWASEHLFDYQLHCRANKEQNFRHILKSRQVGMTYYFAFEAFEDAVLTGDRQVFFSASRAQSEIFKFYIVEIAQQAFGITLTGNPIKLSNGAVLRFLSTNAGTAQGFNGHLYGDEIFWIPKFGKFHETASAMATHNKFRTTYFSTPSAKTHPAYPIWTGDTWREDDAKRKKAIFPKESELRKGGILCPDDQWRYIITMEDAISGGFDLADIERLRNRYNDATFAMLYMCVFVDSKDAVFSFEDLERCGVERDIWQDFDIKLKRPFGDREVWAGYDPARSGDLSTFAVLAPPVLAVEKFRVLEIVNWHGMSFRWQANEIKKLFAKYNIRYLGIDVTGIGNAVFENIQHFAGRVAVPIRYSVKTKDELILKALDVISSNRIEWPKDHTEIPASFLAIRRTTTNSGNSMTFVADRSADTGHAEAAFAIAHALHNEPINYENRPQSRWRLKQAV